MKIYILHFLVFKLNMLFQEASEKDSIKKSKANRIRQKVMADPELACSTEGSGETEADSGMQGDNSTNSNEENGDQDNEAAGVPDPALNTNYDSCDGAIPVSHVTCHISSCSYLKQRGMLLSVV